MVAIFKILMNTQAHALAKIYSGYTHFGFQCTTLKHKKVYCQHYEKRR